MNRAIGEYRVFPRHIGKWEGTVRMLDADLQEIKRFNITQTFKAVDDKWVIINIYLYADEPSSTHSFDIIPLGDGEVKVETQEPLLKEATMKALEHGDNIVDFKVFNPVTGKLQELETITLVSDRDRIRTTQMYDLDGAFKGLIVVVEHKVD